MMKRIRKSAWTVPAVILGLLMSTAVWAEALKGDALLRMLTGGSDSSFQASLERARAMGFLQGMQESYLITSLRDPELQIYCLPAEGIPSARLRSVVVRWLQTHPDRLDEPATLLVFYALADEFPCR